MTQAVSPAGNTAPAAKPETASAPAGFKGASPGADFDTFLKMLTAQLRNQDPLNPMEGTDFAIQLATFAGVEQQAQTNKLLAQMAGGSSGGTGNIASWIGKEARTTAPVWFGQKAITLDIAPAPQAETVQLVTRDDAGREIGRTEIGKGTGQIDWFGRSTDGTKLPDGKYSFTLESWRGEEKVANTKVGAYTRIAEAEFRPSGAVLIFEGGSSAPATEISALRNPA
ncbi:MAG: flagellar hook capping FlgD N-terminal domain-containing protein [Paracoccus sp. (in: a-proteobacteria)]|uniref:flagellar hook capping FlgD N-terminal domain-containing protein n=1 Tax=Paracoccus sp. TaxID=267 RepID=UPI00391AAB04